MINQPRIERLQEDVKKLSGKSPTFDDDLQELIRDAQRLDWLADPENKKGNVQLPVGAVESNTHCLRAAIDAAKSGNYVINQPIVG
jgi:hypothetical protein